MADTEHIGSNRTSPAEIAAAFSTANDLVDTATGLVRSSTISSAGIVPRAKIDTIANLLSSCAQTAGSAQGDGSPCDQLFQATIPESASAARASDTVQVLLGLARNATGFADRPDSFAVLYRLAASSAAFVPALAAEPNDWAIAVQFPGKQETAESTHAETQAFENAIPYTDIAGNIWVSGNGNTVTEFVGGASCAGAPKAFLPIAFNSGNVP